MIRKISIILVTASLLNACATGGIKSVTVKVYKYDGSVSCDQSSGTSLESMQDELLQKKIPIISSSCGSDGLIRAAVCGIDTGHVNVFEIKSNVYPTAQALGYEVVSMLEDYAPMDCRT